MARLRQGPAMLTPGTQAPAFDLESDSGENVSLASLKGKPVVLYFYPKDDTSGCTVEACEFRDAWADVRKTGAVVLGRLSRRYRSHQKFRKKFSLPFPLLADTDHAVAEAYGAWGEKSMYGRTYHGILRTTYVIDRSGKVARVFEKVKPKGHAAEVLAARSRSWRPAGESCPTPIVERGMTIFLHRSSPGGRGHAGHLLPQSGSGVCPAAGRRNPPRQHPAAHLQRQQCRVLFFGVGETADFPAAGTGGRRLRPGIRHEHRRKWPAPGLQRARAHHVRVFLRPRPADPLQLDVQDFRRSARRSRTGPMATCGRWGTSRSTLRSSTARTFARSPATGPIMQSAPFRPTVEESSSPAPWTAISSCTP